MAKKDKQKQQVVGKAIHGDSPRAQHTHPVVLTGKFKREEAKEKEHRKDTRK